MAQRKPRCFRRDGRVATWRVRILGTWRLVCRYHVVTYYDLPRHRVGWGGS